MTDSQRLAPAIRLACRLHSMLRRQLPAGFRRQHGDAMGTAFHDAAMAARERGLSALARVTLRESADVTLVAFRLRVAALRSARTNVLAISPSRKGPSMSNLANDLRHAVRLWRRQPGFTIVVVATLALGLAAATSIWTVADSVLFRPLPHEEPEQLVWIAGTSRELEGARLPLSLPNFVDLRMDGGTGFEDMAAYRWPLPSTVVLDAAPQSLRVVMATGNLFELLGNRAAHGRTFTEQDAVEDANDVVLLSDAVWRTHLGADTDAIGRTIRIDGQPYEIIGVMPPRFAFPWSNVDVWVPMSAAQAIQDRDTQYLTVIGRLAGGVSLDAARPRMEAAMGRLVAAYPADTAGKGVTLMPRHAAVIGDARPAMLALAGASLLLLLLACANIANLMLARGVVRQRELAVRAALGAGRGRLVGQLAIETLAIALLGGVLGVVIAHALVRVLVLLAPPSLPRLGEIVLDGRALAFAAAATLVSGLLFGLLPAIRAGAASTGSALRENIRGEGGRHRGLRGLVVAQLALALVLTSGAGLLAWSFQRLLAVDPGFTAEGVYTFRVAPPPARYEEPARFHAFYDALFAGILALPGVESAGGTWSLPFSPDYASGRVTVEGRPLPEGSEPTVGIIPVRGDYFRTMEMELRAGRWLNDTDGADAPPVVLVNETAARRLWPGEDAVGKRFRRGRADETDLPWITVAGVVEDAKRARLDGDVMPEMYWNHVQAGDWARDLTVVVRATHDAAGLAGPLRETVTRLDPHLAITAATLLETRIADSVAEPRFRTVLLVAFAALALMLAMIGTYGVMAFVVAHRRHEIGVRMALGADSGSVLRSVLRDGLRLIGAATILGLAGTALAARALSGLLFGVQPLEPLPHALAVGLLALTALLACLLPARRAARVDPAQTLRN